jgi:hypothetical protein
MTIKYNPKPVKLDLTDVSAMILLFCAFRYALGRRSYVVKTICDIIKDNWDQIAPVDREKYKKEIRAAIDSECAGSKWDVYEWEKILALED